MAAFKVHPKPDLRQGTSAYLKTRFLFHLITDRLDFVGSNHGMDWRRVWMGFSVKCYLAVFLMFSVKMGKILMLSV